MNSFVCGFPYPLAAQALDYRRLGKQRVEVWQMLLALTGQTEAWSRHPATLAWKGFERSLADFGVACHTEWIRRGYNDTTLPRLIELRVNLPRTGHPWWVTDYDEIRKIRAVLVAKKPSHYSKLWPDVAPATGKQEWPSPVRRITNV